MVSTIKTMQQKLSYDVLNKMTSAQIAAHITEITQTEICKDERYCKQLINLFLNK